MRLSFRHLAMIAGTVILATPLTSCSSAYETEMGAMCDGLRQATAAFDDGDVDDEAMTAAGHVDPAMEEAGSPEDIKDVEVVNQAFNTLGGAVHGSTEAGSPAKPVTPAEQEEIDAGVTVCESY
jgi:hypothetical protein